MPADEDPPRGRRVLSKDRMEGFSDGVFGFAITLLVLDLALHPPGTPLERVLHAWPGYLAYVVSFLTIGGGWLLHTALTDRLARTDSLFLRLNLLVLLVVVFLPFPTKWGAPALPDCGSFRIFTRKDGIKCQGNTGNSRLSSVKRQLAWSWKLRGRSRRLRASSGSMRPRWVTGYGPTVTAMPAKRRRCSSRKGRGCGNWSARTANCG